MMKSVVLTGIRKMEVITRAVPVVCQPHQVLIRMKRVGICGSDIHYYTDGKIGCQVVDYPFVIGHEGAGIIEAVGEKVSRLKPGDRVAIDPAMPCFECDQCEAGKFHTCRNLKFLGCPGQAEGCLSEYIVMPERSCFPIPDSMSFDEAVISEPLAIGYYATKLAGDLRGKNIGVFGFGPIGMSVLLSAGVAGVHKTYVTDRIKDRLALAHRSGAYWTGNPDQTEIEQIITEDEPLLLDYIFECCGKREATDLAIQLLKPGGKLVIIGIPEFERWSFSSDDFRRKEICVQNVRRQNESTQKALDLISSHSVNVEPMVTHHFQIDQTDEAYDLVAEYRDGVMKAIICL